MTVRIAMPIVNEEKKNHLNALAVGFPSDV